jgi:hypothetical protein
MHEVSSDGTFEVLDCAVSEICIEEAVFTEAICGFEPEMSSLLQF